MKARAGTHRNEQHKPTGESLPSSSIAEAEYSAKTIVHTAIGCASGSHAKNVASEWGGSYTRDRLSHRLCH